MEELIHNITDSNYPSNHPRSTSKESRGNTIVSRYLLGIQFHTKRKDGANTTSIWFSKRNSYRYNDALQNTNVKVHSPNGDTDLFNRVSVLQGDILAPYLFLIRLYYVLRTSIDQIKENGFILKRQEADNIP